MAATETLTLNMGPQHPSTHGVLRLVLELDGETVLKTVPHIGYLHTGMEKTMENEMYQQAITITDRMDYLAAMSNNLAYCLAVEKLLEIEVWRDRTIGVGIMDAETALKWGITGPSLRGAGVNYDVRKVNPYCGYENFEFDVPLGARGDVYDRYRVRVAEMRQSVRILDQ